MKKRFLTVAMSAVLAASALVGFAACGDKGNENNELTLPAYAGIVNPDYSNVTIPDTFKFGMICLHDEQSTYDLNFINAAKEAAKEMGLKDNQFRMVTGIPESIKCQEEATKFAQEGYSLVFADSFGHESFMLEAAKSFPNVQFCHATGVKAQDANLDNFHNAFASIYEGRYLAGVAAGLKLKEMGETKMGYVGAFTYAEVISGYTSFYLGAKSIVPEVTMDVQFTGSWYDVTAESEAAKALINKGAKLISQHADSMGAPSACEEAGIPNVSYNGSTIEACPNTFIVSSRIDWKPYFKYIIAQAATGAEIDDDWTGSIKTGSVVLTNLNGNVVKQATVDKIVEVRDQLVQGTVNVFDTANFTVENKKVESFKVKETEVIENGIFKESKVRSAPYFELKIDGITLLNEKF